MFDTPTPNRRMTLWEREQELEDAIIWHRVPRTYIKDKPFYPWVRTDERFCVNFDLNPPLN